ncbi:MAG: hypothetical protein Q8O88_04140 [bacterium]|nr:hypothetical protein [bacterium]
MTDRLLLTEKTLKAFKIKHFLMKGDKVMASCPDGVVVRRNDLDIDGVIKHRTLYAFILIDIDVIMTIRQYFGKELENATIECVWWNNDVAYVIPIFSELKPTTVKINSKSWNDFNVEGALIAWHMEACKSAKIAIYELYNIACKNKFLICPEKCSEMLFSARKVLYDRAKKLSCLMDTTGLKKIINSSVYNGIVKKWKKQPLKHYILSDFSSLQTLHIGS